MAVSTRFRGPASDVDLTRLLNRGLSVLAGCLVVAALAHVGVMLRSVEFGGAADSRPLTTRFIQRQPRMTKPMELRKKPKPRQRKMVRQQVQLQARTSRLLTSQVGGISLRSLSAPQVSLDEGAELVSIDLGGGVTDIGVSTSKEPDNKIDMKEQLLDLNFLDTGKYQAMVIQDPDDKRNIKGYFHVAQAYSSRMIEGRVQSTVTSDAGAALLQSPFAVTNLVNALNEFTDIQADFSTRLSLSSQELMETPWIFVPQVTFTLTEGELVNVGAYLAGGGFILADAGRRVGSDTDVFIRQMVRDALATVNRQARFIRLPHDHPIYHSYFDFDHPPKALAGTPASYSNLVPGEGRDNVDYLTGVELDGRLVAVISYQALGIAWENVAFRNNRNAYLDNSRHLQFGINTIVFALTQEGSITNRVMENVR